MRQMKPRCHARKTALLASAVCGVLFLTSAMGCSGGKSIKPGTYEVDIRVVRVLQAGNDTVGDLLNEGCRFSDAQITELMNDAIAHASVFGTNTNLQWNGTITNAFSPDQFVYRDIGLNPPSPIFSGLGSLFQFNGTWAPQPNVINIYFCGYFYSWSDDNNNGIYNVGEEVPVYAAAIDPELAGPSGLYSPGIIWVNDQGSPDDFGTEFSTNYEPRPILLHELAHYLAYSFDGQTFGSGASARTYDDGEHLDPPASGNLLTPDIGFNRDYSDAVIPGQEYSDSNPSQAQDELGEISRRIFQGRWNNP